VKKGPLAKGSQPLHGGDGQVPVQVGAFHFCWSENVSSEKNEKPFSKKNWTILSTHCFERHCSLDDFVSGGAQALQRWRERKLPIGRRLSAISIAKNWHKKL
jgi:hypothetical protein